MVAKMIAETNGSHLHPNVTDPAHNIFGIVSAMFNPN
jgi:hypothetical protein